MPRDTVLVGLCTGLLAAGAVLASQTILDLIGNALQVVEIAYRIGVKVNDIALRLSTTNEVHALRNLSKLVLRVHKEASAMEIAEFNRRKV